MKADALGQHLSAVDLAERIAHFAKIRLCENPDGLPAFNDYLLAECDRYLICHALRQLGSDGEGGLSKRAVRLLGFDKMCQCGHEYGLHEAPGTECVVLDCKCGHFRTAEKE